MMHNLLKSAADLVIALFYGALRAIGYAGVAIFVTICAIVLFGVRIGVGIVGLFRKPEAFKSTGSRELDQKYQSWVKHYGRDMADAILAHYLQVRDEIARPTITVKNDLSELGLVDLPQSKKELRAAYLKRVKEVRPDNVANNDAAVRLNLAYDRLKAVCR